MNLNERSFTSNSKFSNIEDCLKLLAIILMFVDHIGVFFFPNISNLRVLGRAVMPIFCFFAGYNSTKVRLRVLFGGLFITIFTSIFCYERIYVDLLCIIFLGQCLIVLFKRYKFNALTIFFITAIILLISFTPLIRNNVNYSIISLAFMLCGYIARMNNLNYQYLLVLNLISYLIYSQVGFQFSLSQVIFLGIELAGVYILLLLKFNQKIPVNCKFIARNSLIIYVIHLPIFIILWRCKILIA
jgi:hypothetical protein